MYNMQFIAGTEISYSCFPCLILLIKKHLAKCITKNIATDICFNWLLTVAYTMLLTVSFRTILELFILAMELQKVLSHLMM